MTRHFFLEEGFCDRALPAADFDVLLVRPSRRTWDAALAAFGDVTFVVFRCDKALPAADLDALPVTPDFNVFEALEAALPDVFFPAIGLVLLSEGAFPRPEDPNNTRR